jgi:hypothetical protein
LVSEAPSLQASSLPGLLDLKTTHYTDATVGGRPGRWRKVTFRVTKSGYIFPKYFRKEGMKVMATRRTSATYFEEKMLKIKARLWHFSSISSMHL